MAVCDQEIPCASTWKDSRIYPLVLSLLAVLVGVVAAFGAVVFRALISVFHNLLFLGTFSFHYEANVHTAPSPWGPMVVFVPVIGALGVSLLVRTFAPEAKGHGVPEVMDAIYYGRGVIRPVVAVVKSLASALSIGSGGSVGREGPIIQIGSSFGSTLGQIVRVPAWQRVTLIACGTGAGIAATFNTPIGGMLFAVEVILHEVSLRTMVPVALATATATYIGQLFFGVHPAFFIPEIETLTFRTADPMLLLSYVGLGLIAGLGAALYIRSIYALEDWFDRWKAVDETLRHMIGMLAVGLLMFALMRLRGHYYIEGVGYATIEDVLTGRLDALGLMALLFALKLAATAVTLGSGGSGGIFSPALFLGAMLGGAYGTLVGGWTTLPVFSVSGFAIAGMAGIVGGSTGAALAAVVMIFEMTLDYNVVLPVTITVAVANAVRWAFSRETIYTLKLSRRGHTVPQALQTSFAHLRRANAIMSSPPIVFPATMPLAEFARAVSQDGRAGPVLVESDGVVLGFVAREAGLRAIAGSADGLLLGDVVSRRYVRVHESDTMQVVLDRLRREQADLALVTADRPPAGGGQVLGLITRADIAATMEEALDLFT